MLRIMLISSIVLFIGSIVLFFVTRFLGLPVLLLFLGKTGMVVGGVASLGIRTSLWLFGKDRTHAFLTNILVLATTAMFLMIGCEFAVRSIFRDITTTSDNSSYFARNWYNENVRFNSWGFREEEFHVDKPEDMYRIAIIGDSFTFGQGIQEKGRFSNLLETYLSNKGRYQVLNFGKPGTETVDHLTILRDVVLKTEPDFVILQWFVNDFEGRNKSGRPRYRRLLPSDTLSSILHRYSALYYLFNQKWQSLQEAFGLCGRYVEYMHQRFNDPRSPESLKAMTALTNFIDQCQNRRIGLCIVLFPMFGVDLGASYPFSYLHEQVFELCDLKGVRCLDLRATFAQYPERRQLWANRFDAHPSSLANQLAADRLIEVLGPIWLSAHAEPPKIRAGFLGR